MPTTRVNQRALVPYLVQNFPIYVVCCLFFSARRVGMLPSPWRDDAQGGAAHDGLNNTG